jgi:hypothetical protein
VEILAVEQLGLPVFQPLGAGEGLAFWARALTARIVGDPLIAEIVALLDVTAQRRRSTPFDRDFLILAHELSAGRPLEDESAGFEQSLVARDLSPGSTSI